MAAIVLDKGMRAVSTEISPETGAGGFILPNDRVDVILSRRDREGREVAESSDPQTSEIILVNVRVLGDRPDARARRTARTVVDRQDRDARS